MAKVFSITEGMENMGAMKTGGQGSVYKVKKTGTIISAIKILPTPIFSESNDDKNYVAFRNEVEKLQLVNRHPNPHVVNFISSGIADSGNFPYIEMEFIDGLDLEELLKPPHQNIFTIKEVTKVAEQLASALAHCHQLDVKHGDIKSNNVKFNRRTGNYVLLDFGLAALSDEQRRTSLRHAGAIEFMAPEQYDGELLFETDIYSFGIILFELLASTVPFPLNDKSESARNLVRLAHIEKPLPDISQLRREAVHKTDWSAAVKSREVNIPAWLLNLVDVCLQKKPANRFSNGMVLRDFISNNSMQVAQVAAHQPNTETSDIVQQNKWLLGQQNQLQKQVDQYKVLVDSKNNDIDELKEIIARKNQELVLLQTAQRKPSGFRLPTSLLIVLLLVAIGAYAAYEFVWKKDEKVSGKNEEPVANTPVKSRNSDTQNFKPVNAAEEKDASRPANKKGDVAREKKQAKVSASFELDFPAENSSQASGQKSTTGDQKQASTEQKTSTSEPPVVSVPDKPVTNEERPRRLGLFSVVDKAFFYNEPDEATKRNAFILRENNAVLAALNENSNFIYVVYTNKDGQTSKGWLRKSDLNKLTQ